MAVGGHKEQVTQANTTLTGLATQTVTKDVQVKYGDYAMEVTRLNGAEGRKGR